MQNIDIFTAAVAFLSGGLFIHFFGVRKTRVRTLEKALQESCLKYALLIEKSRQELEQYKGERIVFKGIINADTQRAERLMEELVRVKADVRVLNTDLLRYRSRVIAVRNEVKVFRDTISACTCAKTFSSVYTNALAALNDEPTA